MQLNNKKIPNYIHNHVYINPGVRMITCKKMIKKIKTGFRVVKYLKGILIFKAIRMSVFLETFQVYDIDMLMTYYKNVMILPCIFFWEIAYIKHQQE